MKEIKREIITPQDEYNYFFGYYDLQPFSADNTKHLTHRVKFMDRLPNKDDIAEIGYIDIANKQFIKITQTRAFNFQQGALLRWFEKNKSVTFNDFDGEKYIARVVGLDGREVDRYDMPFATMSEEKGVALSINFSRIYDFRKGYGYVNIPDRFFDDNAPKDDGIFTVDLKSKKTSLLISYAKLKEIVKEPPFSEQKLVVNHINFSPSGEKFVFLLRNVDPNGKMWGTVLAVGDLNGNIKKLTNFEINSHYSWKDNKTLMIWSGLPEWGIYFIDTVTGERKKLNNPVTDRGDIHCNYSPDRSCFIADGYIEKDGKRYLYYYDFSTKKACALFGVYSMPLETDIRCDLHARFSGDGTLISYDTTENGSRQITLLPFSKKDIKSLVVNK